MAIGTAKRMGAVVEATDVRPVVKEQVESLGGTFLEVEMTEEEKAQAETAGGYAREMSDDYKRRQAELIASRVGEADAVITTALIPGRPAPKLITADMIRTMRPGSVIVDMAAEMGGNTELTEAGKEIVTDNGVRIIGFTNLPATMPAAPPRCTPRTSRPWSSTSWWTASSTWTSPTRSRGDHHPRRQGRARGHRCRAGDRAAAGRGAGAQESAQPESPEKGGA